MHPNPVLRASALPVRRVGKNERRLLRQMIIDHGAPVFRAAACTPGGNAG